MSFNFGTVSSPSDAILTLNSPNAPFAAWDNPQYTTSDNDPVTFLVVAQNLIQTSCVFKAALTGPWKEGVVTEDGVKNLEAEGWDSEAMRIVLSAIHHRTKDIPRRVTLEMLCKIAVLVDYYELHDSLFFFLHLWINDLQSPLPKVHGRDLILWICITSIFTSATIHEAVTSVAISHCPGEFRTLDLPIPGRVENLINTRREAALSQLIASLNDIKGKLLEDTSRCSFECRSAHLGALIIHMHDERLLDGAIEPPFEGRSVADTVKRIRAMRSPSKDWHVQTSTDSLCELSLRSVTETALKAIDAIQGLELDDVDDYLVINSTKKGKRGKGRNC
ncbi:hypothetical protein B0H66DRAFT_539033 [Apodospora peruviana]|uniref:BTB domain-containing protein n=1 Tax=Apodospora peruviana TaxID=516989 RepID=A0AAE0HSI7_9PEZI|nr:hypothetical protein B0H66DRAFT_539033 [Apodospora peruviana]